MQSILKAIAIFFIAISLLFLLLILSDVKNAQDFFDLISFKFLDVRVAFYDDKMGFSMFPYVIFGLLTSILCAINSSWVLWSSRAARIFISILLFLISLVFLFTPYLHFDPM